ncbi:hypothetical protein P280DRAFT_505257 [Massarina eburnea CBS 473.64]|uniref:Uncharacterized protein n=1 Tax=Massarina eburnea CBS 473.64 TaxID=1395130 RepID=A0A6A6S999_9PLEO|nr:hypothetical protein P280DRAFT_505257 [Massarina eburnea CBS 473.64]
MPRFMCASGDSTFMGCCTSNSCQNNNVCPSGNILPAFMDSPTHIAAFIIMLTAGTLTSWSTSTSMEASYTVKVSQAGVIPSSSLSTTPSTTPTTISSSTPKLSSNTASKSTTTPAPATETPPIYTTLDTLNPAHSPNHAYHHQVPPTHFELSSEPARPGNTWNSPASAPDHGYSELDGTAVWIPGVVSPAASTGRPGSGGGGQVHWPRDSWQGRRVGQGGLVGRVEVEGGVPELLR